MPAHPPDRLELRQRQFLLSRSQRWTLWAALVLPLVVVVAGVWLLVQLAPPDSRGDRRCLLP